MASDHIRINQLRLSGISFWGNDIRYLGTRLNLFKSEQDQLLLKSYILTWFWSWDRTVSEQAILPVSHFGLKQLVQWKRRKRNTKCQLLTWSNIINSWQARECIYAYDYLSLCKYINTREFVATGACNGKDNNNKNKSVYVVAKCYNTAGKNKNIENAKF